MPKTYTTLRKEYQEAVDDDFEGLYHNDEEDDSDVVDAIDQLPGAGSLKADIPTKEYEQDSDDLSAVEWKEVDDVKPIYVRGPSGIYTLSTEEFDRIVHDEAVEMIKKEGYDYSSPVPTNRKDKKEYDRQGASAYDKQKARWDARKAALKKAGKPTGPRRRIGRSKINPNPPSNMREEDLEVSENIFHKLAKIVSRNQHSKYKFNDGSVGDIDLDTATSVLKTYGSLNPQNQARFAEVAQGSKDGFAKVSNFAVDQGSKMQYTQQEPEAQDAS